MALVDDRRVEGLICATAATTLHDVGARSSDGEPFANTSARCSVSSPSPPWIATSCGERSMPTASAIMRMPSYTKRRTRPDATLSSHWMQRVS